MVCVLIVDLSDNYLFVIRLHFCFFKQKTAYEMRISDWSSDVCSSDLAIPNGCEREYSSSKLGDKVYEIACSRGVRTQKAIRNRGSGRRRAESWRSPAGDHGDRHLPH